MRLFTLYGKRCLIISDSQPRHDCFPIQVRVKGIMGISTNADLLNVDRITMRFAHHDMFGGLFFRSDWFPLGDKRSLVGSKYPGWLGFEGLSENTLIIDP